MLPHSLQSAFMYASSVVFTKIIKRSVWFLQRGVPTDDQVQEPIRGTLSSFREWTPELTVLKSMQVNKKNSPGPAQVQNCCTFGLEGLLFTLSLSFTLKKHPSPTSSVTKHWKGLLHLWRWLMIDMGCIPKGLGLGSEDSWEITGSPVGAGSSLRRRDAEAEL